MGIRIKICGITRVEDARAAIAAGADAIGLVFAPNTPRVVSIEQARAIAAVVPPFVSAVGLFVDAEADRVRAVLNGVRLSLLQFHGSETPEQCRLFDRPNIKAIPMRPAVNLATEERRYADAAGLLLDAFDDGVPGGTGRSFDWTLVPARRTKPIVLAGGLNADNVAEAIRRVRPDGVDVTSGVEAGKGIKDPAKIGAFIAAVRAAA
jgi:phosphoribosylanthranilate isomerase